MISFKNAMVVLTEYFQSHQEILEEWSRFREPTDSFRAVYSTFGMSPPLPAQKEVFYFVETVVSSFVRLREGRASSPGGTSLATQAIELQLLKQKTHMQHISQIGERMSVDPLFSGRAESSQGVSFKRNSTPLEKDTLEAAFRALSVEEQSSSKSDQGRSGCGLPGARSGIRLPALKSRAVSVVSQEASVTTVVSIMPESPPPSSSSAPATSSLRYDTSDKLVDRLTRIAKTILQEMNKSFKKECGAINSTHITHGISRGFAGCTGLIKKSFEQVFFVSVNLLLIQGSREEEDFLSVNWPDETDKHMRCLLGVSRRESSSHKLESFEARRKAGDRTCDVRFYIGKKTLFAHKDILGNVEFFRDFIKRDEYRFEDFLKLLPPTYSPSEGHLFEVDIFDDLFHFLYTGSIVFTRKDMMYFVQMMHISELFGVFKITQTCKILLLGCVNKDTLFFLSRVAEETRDPFFKRICEKKGAKV